MTAAAVLRAAAEKLRATAAEDQLHVVFGAAQPDVALALADWLDATADEMTAADGTEYEHAEYPSWTAAVALARLINPKETPDAQ